MRFDVRYITFLPVSEWPLEIGVNHWEDTSYQHPHIQEKWLKQEPHTCQQKAAGIMKVRPVEKKSL
jgi:hypothetical protein